MKKILFFTPRGGYNGAEMQLAHLLRYTKKGNFDWKIVQFGTGNVFSSEGHVTHSLGNYSFKSRLKNVFVKAVTGYTTLENYIKRLHNDFKPDLWYINSINTYDVSVIARRLGVPYIVHCHELAYYYGHSHSELSLREMLEGAAFNIGCSSQVTRNLSLMARASVSTVFECIDHNKIKVSDEETGRIRTKLRIPEGAYVWGMSGGAYYRKGFDIIPQILKLLESDNISFLWIGDVMDSGYAHYVNSLVKHYDLKNLIVTGTQTTQYYNYLNLLDGFLLSSREDPFPLVMIEAAALGKPIVSFDSGGAKEFVNEDMGIVIECYKPEMVAAAMKKVMMEWNPNAATALKKRAREFDAQVISKSWQELLKTCC